MKETWVEYYFDVVKKEFDYATSRFSAFNNAHEGYAVLLEEVDELWENVKLNQHKNQYRDKLIMNEAIQVAAMAMRVVHDCCEKVFLDHHVFPLEKKKKEDDKNE